jgi:hypothetical protein
MPSFLYFIETGLSALRPNESANVSCMLRRAMQRESDGPDGRHGILIHEAEEDGDRCLFNPDAQRWERWGECLSGPVWVGMWKDSPPRPEDLEHRRDIQQRDIALSLGDGNEWAFPQVYYKTGEPAVRQVMGHDEKRAIVTRPHPRFASLCDQGARVWDALRSAGLGSDIPAERRITEADKLQFIVEALAINYRVTGVEIGMLSLLYQDAIDLCCGYLVQIDVLATLREFLQREEVQGKA